MADERREGYTQLTADVAVIKEQVGSMHEHLFGNGQPGILAKIVARIWRIEVALILVVGVLIGLGLLQLDVLGTLIQ